MTLDDIIIITCLVLAVAFRALYQYFSWNVWLRYRNKKCRPGWIRTGSGADEKSSLLK